ncbi:MAG TPA: cupin domain-containing protein [Thermoanaerobaculia bacterium]|jgi:quercetin dioxygenase-like cupin family protein|nr:cupin domain-containing protein [Thermoanaerobaculia bacterium]
MKKARRSVVLLFAVALVAGLGALAAQQTAPAVKRTVLLKQDMTVPGREAVMVLVELPPGVAEGRHTHNAEVFAFVQEGTILLEVEGKPNATLKAGDYFYIAPGQVHQGTNTGTVPTKLSVVFVAEKGKPLTTPVQ